MVNSAKFPDPVTSGAENLSMAWMIAERYFDFGGKSFKIEEIKPNTYKLVETKSHEPFIIIALKIISIPVLGLLFLGIRHYFRKKYENKIITLRCDDKQTEAITKLKDNTLPPSPNKSVDKVKTEVDPEDKKNVKEFRESLSLLFKPPESGGEKKRNNELAKIMKTGYKILQNRIYEELAPWGEFNSCYSAASEFFTLYGDGLQLFSEDFFEIPLGNRDIGQIYAGNHPCCLGGYKYVEASSQKSINSSEPKIKKNNSTEPKLIIKTSKENRKYALLQKTFHVNKNHFAVMAFDPIRGKYVDCNNFQSMGKEILISEEKISSLDDLFTGKGYEELGPCNELWIDLEYIDLFLNPDDWKGLNWVLPKWEDNNCYLAVSWLETAYKMKISEIFFKRSGVEAN